MTFFSVGKDIDIMSNDERNLEVLRYSSGADSTLGILSENFSCLASVHLLA